MSLELGYLLPTREQIMSGHNETGGMLALAERAEHLGRRKESSFVPD